MTDCTRRFALGFAAAAAAAAVTGCASATAQKKAEPAATAAAPAAPAAPKHEFPRVPTDWYPQGLMEGFESKGTGVSFPGPAGRPVAYCAFDPQCRWCIKLLNDWMPLKDLVDVHWMPVALLNIHSEPQGAQILASKNPAKMMLEQHDHFKDPDFKGLRYDLTKIPEKFRTAVWENSKIFRRNACRTVPYGVFKDAKGVYRPIYSGMSTEELAKLFGVKNPA